MRALDRVTGRMAPLLMENVDTDQIIPARYLKTLRREGLGPALFANWRYRDGLPDPGFVLNQEEFQGASILLAGENFGSGSSREHAVWALQEAGFQAVVSTRIADIFRTNALKNGMLALQLPAADFATLVWWARTDPGAVITIDLAEQSLHPPSGPPIAFNIDPFVRHRLLRGVDELDFLLAQTDEIDAFEAGRAEPLDSGTNCA